MPKHAKICQWGLWGCTFALSKMQDLREKKIEKIIKK